jgi:hypothetical protein
MAFRRSFALILFALVLCGAQQPYTDGRHPSRVFGEQRNYRIFLPASYTNSPQKRYPVIYYFHGHSDRYTLEKYDNGMDTVPKIAAFTAAHDAIVVAADGYVARDYQGFYGGTPYDVRRDGGDYDYGEYFLELVRYIDSNYRTLTTRRYRATSGLSMGGFMSLYLSARYPDLVGSASSFNPGPEFYAGEKGRRSLWRPKDHTANHEHSMVRLIRASGDYISQYHEETREAFARAAGVDFEFRQDEYHRHWATSIGETFEFHMRAFGNPALDVTPAEWSYASAHREFEVWGVRIRSGGAASAQGTALPHSSFIYLEQVGQGGMRVRTRAWAPDGPPAPSASIQVTTSPLYRPGAAYRVMDYSLASGALAEKQATADAEGRILFTVDGAGHEISFTGPGATGQPPILLPATGDALRVRPATTVALPIRIYNPRGAAQDIRAEVTSSYPTVEILKGMAEWKGVAWGQSVAPNFQARFTATSGDWQHARLNVKLTYDGWVERNEIVDVLIAPDPIPPPAEIVILDGRSHKFNVFRQKGNQGGGESVVREIHEGEGNGNGVLEPGENATIWVRIPQGLDPFDKNNWRRAKVYSDSPWLTEIADLQEEKQREWTGAQNRTSLVRLSPKTPAGTEIPMFLDCESWSFHFTPDVRYGRELLYQAFQFHRHDVFGWTWK